MDSKKRRHQRRDILNENMPNRNVRARTPRNGISQACPVLGDITNFDSNLNPRNRVPRTNSNKENVTPTHTISTPVNTLRSTITQQSPLIGSVHSLMDQSGSAFNGIPYLPSTFSVNDVGSSSRTRRRYNIDSPRVLDFDLNEVFEHTLHIIE